MRTTASTLPNNSRYSDVSRIDRGYPDMIKPLDLGLLFMADIKVADICRVVKVLVFLLSLSFSSILFMVSVMEI